MRISDWSSDVCSSDLPNGFLNTVTGLKFKKVIDSVSAPRDADDDRTGAQRRVQGLDDLLTAILANGLTNDKGVRPHVDRKSVVKGKSVSVRVDTGGRSILKKKSTSRTTQTTSH